MRITVILLGLVGVLVLAFSGALALHARTARKASVVASGVVTALNEGPYYAEVSVTGADGRRFYYVENGSHSPLAVGQTLSVRYQPSAPEETAEIDRSPYDLAAGVATLGLVLLLAGALSPLAVRLLPGVLTPPIRR